MKNFPLIVALIFCSFLGTSGIAQNKHIKAGDKLYEQMVYPGAVRSYERGLAQIQDLRAMERLADSYVQLSNTTKAEQWYGEAVKMKGSAPVNKLRYGQMLKANKKYTEARTWFEAYMQTGENPQLAGRMIEACDFAMEHAADTLQYKISPEPCNSKGSEFGPVLFKQGYIFAGEHKGAGRKYINLRNANGFYDLFYAERKPGSKSGVKVSPVKGPINRRYHEGPACVNRDQSRLYFTRSNYVKDKKGKAPVNHSRLKIYTVELKMGKWTNLEPMPFNSDNYNVGHPTLSVDGNTMVFASDIPGGFGGTDLYMTRKEGNAWSVPQNLGSAVNTEGDEQFPYLHPSGTLFYSSTGWAGFGGMDIFASKREGEKWGRAENAGFGINSAADDFSMAWLPGKSAGYFASNRGGDDNLYSFKRQMKIKGTIVDKRTGKPLPGVSVNVLDANNAATKYTTGDDGTFTHLSEWGKDYLLTASKNEFLQLRERITTSDANPMEDISRTFVMEHDLVLSVSGLVTDAATNAPLDGATVRVVGQSEKTVKSDAQGNYFSQIDTGKEYTVIVKKPGYMPFVSCFSTEGKTASEDWKFNAALVRGPSVLVEGRTVEMESRAPISEVNVRSIDMKQGEEVQSSLCRKDGRFWQVVDPRREPTLIASKVGYFSARTELEGVDSTTQDTTIQLEIGMVKYEVGALVKVIYYDYNKSDIKKTASKDLLEIAYFLQDNPEASVQLSSYTDSRGGSPYNQSLSQRRADAAVAYIVSKKVASNRIASIGYGETGLVNNCKDGVECTDEQHGLNRRTEIRITKVDPTGVK